jgi:hypothetical protein
MGQVITLQTNDAAKLVQFESHQYKVQGYFTLSVRVISGSFQGKSSFYSTRDQLIAFASEVKDLYKHLKGRASLHDCESDAFVSLEGFRYGQVAVSGQVGGSHQDHFMKFRFETDQTVLLPLHRQIIRLLTDLTGNAPWDNRSFAF